MMCIWYELYMYALRIQNTSESDPRSYEATKAVTKKAQKQFWGFNGIWTLASIEASEFFLGFLYNCFSCFITVTITFTSILYPQSIHMIYIINT